MTGETPSGENPRADPLSAPTKDSQDKIPKYQGYDQKRKTHRQIPKSKGTDCDQENRHGLAWHRKKNWHDLALPSATKNTPTVAFPPATGPTKHQTPPRETPSLMGRSPSGENPRADSSPASNTTKNSQKKLSKHQGHDQKRKTHRRIQESDLTDGDFQNHHGPALPPEKILKKIGVSPPAKPALIPRPT